MLSLRRLAVLSSLAGLSFSVAALAQSAASVDLPEQPLDQAIKAIAQQTGIQIVFVTDITAGRRAPALRGSFTPREAIDRLLAGSGLAVEQQGDGTLLIVPRPNGGATLMQAVQVSAVSESATTEGSGSYTARASTIGKTEHTLREIPQSVSVITRQQIEDRNATTVDEVMRYATGIGAYNNEGQGASSFYARGFAALQVQLDGVASVGVGGSEFDMARFDRIEIQRGPSGLLQGSGNPAGTINFVRKRGGHDFALSGGLFAGSWNQYRGEVDVGGPINASGSVRGRAVMARQERDYFYDDAHGDSELMHVGLDVDLTPGTTLGMAVAHQSRTQPVSAGITFYSDGRAPDWGRSTNTNAPWSESEIEVDEYVVDLSHKLDRNWSVDGALRYREYDFEYLAGRLNGALDPATGRVAAFRQENQAMHDKAFSADVHVSGHFSLFGQQHELLLGVNTDRTTSDYWWAVPATTGSFDPLDVPYDLASAPHATPKSRTETVQSGAYGVLRLKVLDPLMVILGGRLSDYNTRTHSLIAGESRDWTQGATADSEFTPYGAVLWDFTSNFTLYASYADVFIPQATRDWSGRTLDPRVGWQIESGIKGEFYDGALNTTLAVFRIRDKNRPINDLDPDHQLCGTTLDQPCQTEGGLMQNQGWEFDLSGSPLHGLELTAGYTRSLTKYLRDNNPARVGITQVATTYTPHDMVKLWGNYELPQSLFGGALQKWSVGGGVRAQSETSGGLIHQGGYTVYSLQSGYRISSHWKAALTVDNLFDKVYFRQLNGPAAFNYYGEPRNFMLAVRGNW